MTALPHLGNTGLAAVEAEDHRQARGSALHRRHLGQDGDSLWPHACQYVLPACRLRRWRCSLPGWHWGWRLGWYRRIYRDRRWRKHLCPRELRWELDRLWRSLSGFGLPNKLLQ